MALVFDLPTSDIQERDAINYWTAIYNYFKNSKLSDIFDFTELVIDTETYANTGFSFTYKISTPLYQIGNKSPDTFSLRANNSDLSSIIFSQTIKLSSYASVTATYDTSSFTKDVPIRIAKSENCIYMLLFGKTKGCPLFVFNDEGYGCAYVHSQYYTQFIYAVGVSSIVYAASVGNFNQITRGESPNYYLKPITKGSAIFTGLLLVDGGPNTTNISGDFKFNGEEYFGLGTYIDTNNWVLKL